MRRCKISNFEPHHSFLLCKSAIYWCAKTRGVFSGKIQPTSLESSKILRPFIRQLETQALRFSNFMYTVYGANCWVWSVTCFLSYLLWVYIERFPGPLAAACHVIGMTMHRFGMATHQSLSHACYSAVSHDNR